MMFLSRLLTGGGKRKRVAREWVRSIAAQARRTELYGDDGVRDSVEGRTEMMLFHAIPVLRRLRDIEGEGPKLAKALYEALFANLEYGMRESGAGDFTIGKKMRLLGEAYLGRARAYDAALASGQREVKEALTRNLHDVARSHASFDILADYLVALSTNLAEESDATLLEGQLNWPDITVFYAEKF